MTNKPFDRGAKKAYLLVVTTESDMTNTLNHQAEAQALIDRGALVVINHSGGKDSQAQMIKLLALGIPARQLVVMHADLGEVEWHGATDKARTQAEAAGIEFVTAKAIYKDGSEKTLLNYVEYRNRKNIAKHAAGKSKKVDPCWPSKGQRWCTSELKRDPIAREIRRVMDERGLKLAINCEGIRADESDDRAAKNPFEPHKTLNGPAGREVWNWYPIFTLTTFDVFATIRGAGQQPHQAYYSGNKRLSCVFCVFGCKGDIVNGARQRPELFAKYAALEASTGFTAKKKSLIDLVREAQV
jgi:3'-phosphoadenosine 5'-phosphosulfate sulfotransferase (PAPS reductase)/FAD synthetase